jgi:hypothetical protein
MDLMDLKIQILNVHLTSIAIGFLELNR